METILPTSPLLIRLFAESPWTLAFPMLGAAAILAWWGVRAERVRPILVAVGLLLVAAATLAIAAMRVSPGEHAAAAVRDLVSAAELADIPGVRNAFAEDATMHYGSPQAPGDDLERLMRAAETLAGRHRIQRNSITELDYATLDDQRGVVILGCLTETASSFGPIPTRWYFVVRRTPDDRWKIEQIAWLKMLNQEPSRNF